MDGQINNLLVADISVWSLAETSIILEKNNIDSFAQLGLNNIKYYKTRKYTAGYPFNSNVQIIPKRFLYFRSFFNEFELVEEF